MSKVGSENQKISQYNKLNFLDSKSHEIMIFSSINQKFIVQQKSNGLYWKMKIIPLYHYWQQTDYSLKNSIDFTSTQYDTIS